MRLAALRGLSCSCDAGAQWYGVRAVRSDRLLLNAGTGTDVIMSFQAGRIHDPRFPISVEDRQRDAGAAFHYVGWARVGVTSLMVWEPGVGPGAAVQGAVPVARYCCAVLSRLSASRLASPDHSTGKFDQQASQD